MKIETIKITHGDVVLEMTKDELKQFYLDLKVFFNDVTTTVSIPFMQETKPDPFQKYKVTCTEPIDRGALDPNTVPFNPTVTI